MEAKLSPFNRKPTRDTIVDDHRRFALLNLPNFPSTRLLLRQNPHRCNKPPASRQPPPAEHLTPPLTVEDNFQSMVY
ncbi:hypothetical protein L1987_17274 [Smallanthus sonchifolius]|uniref:Uncharacterized protein n=1 Tax=Smallanthus sonchifolius TaxID=185202 RepID=A0ACB9IY02_9ASTR|nr:hypothetical protein L1987_17274 [Smallanthus sonchifolius]